jgi:hypothetical protein
MASSTTSFDNQTYYNSAVIKPPEDDTYYEGETRFTRFVVDSKDRNKSCFPLPNKYDVIFDDDINDVVSAQLLNISAPMPMYLINSYFNTFNVVLGTTTYSIILSDGDYKPDELATEITSKLNSITSTTAFTCIYVIKTDNFTFTNNAKFSLDFRVTPSNPNSLAMLLGFETKNYNSIYQGGNYVLSSSYRKNFEYNNYIVMFIDNFDINKNQCNPLNKSFAIVCENYTDQNIADTPLITKYFNPPLNKLSKITISFFDRYGNPYDFQNMDHRFELLFSSHKQRRKYGVIMKNHAR